jgi:hypothetical protein
MRLEAYVILTFSIGLVLYLLGYQSIGIMMLFGQQGGGFLDFGTILNVMTSSILNGGSGTGPLAVIGLGLVAAAATALILGFSALFIIPIVMLIALLNFLVFPFSFLITAPNDPIASAFYIPFVVFMNILCVLALASFVRGGNV